jgi:hypothetical protein
LNNLTTCDVAAAISVIGGGELALIDPAGGCEPAEFGVARRVAQCLAVTGPSALAGLTETARSADPSLSRRLFDVCVAVELVIEVRHGTTSPHMFVGIGSPAQTFTADTRQPAEAVPHRKKHSPDGQA